MRVEGMSTVRGAIGRLVAVAALASGLAIASPLRADSWKDALRDADYLHDAAEDLHERAVRLHDHQAMPVTAALDQAAANLYHGLKHEPCAAEIVPLLNQTEALLSETASVMALSCALHTDRKAVALLADAQHHFADTAEHIECVLHDHHHHHVAPNVRYSQPRTTWPSSPWPASPHGTRYSAPPAWLGQPAPPPVWSSGYRGASQGSHHNKHSKKHSDRHYVDEHHDRTRVDGHTGRPLPRVLISGISVR